MGGDDIREWLRETAEFVLDNPDRYDLLIAYTWGRPITLNGRPDKHSNNLFQKLGYPTKPDRMVSDGFIQNLQTRT